MFVGMVAAFLAAEVYARITKGITITMPEGVQKLLPAHLQQ